MLPNESLLVVLQFADYRTLVHAKLAGARFVRIVTKFAEELARRRSFRVFFFATWIMYTDGTSNPTIRYEPGNQASLAAACRALASEIGPHAVSELMFSESTWSVPRFGVVFEAAPLLKHADEVLLYGYSSDETMIAANSEAFMSNFTGIKSLRLCLDNEAFPQFSWTFLRREAARDLRCIELVGWPLLATENISRSVEELVRECASLPRLQGGEALELDFLAKLFSGAFGLRIIELLKNSRLK